MSGWRSYTSALQTDPWGPALRPASPSPSPFVSFAQTHVNYARNPFLCASPKQCYTNLASHAVGLLKPLHGVAQTPQAACPSPRPNSLVRLVRGTPRAQTPCLLYMSPCTVTKPRTCTTFPPPGSGPQLRLLPDNPPPEDPDGGKKRKAAAGRCVTACANLACPDAKCHGFILKCVYKAGEELVLPCRYCALLVALQGGTVRALVYYPCTLLVCKPLRVAAAVAAVAPLLPF